MNPWMPGARRVETAARGGYGNDGQMHAEAIVTHVMEGWMPTMELWARERPAHHRASYHFSIALNGEIVQFVPIDTPAWHAGRLDDGHRPPWPGWKGANLNVNAYTVGVAREGMHDQPWTDAQKASLSRVYRFVLDEHNLVASARTLIGHKDIAPVSRAHDPGGGWDPLDYIGDLDMEPSPPPGTLVDRIRLAYSGAWRAMPRTSTEDVYEVRVKR